MSLSIKGKTAVVLLTAEELATLLNVDEDVLPSLRLAKYSFSGHVRYSYTDIVAFLKANRIEPPKAPKARLEFSRKHRHLELVPEAAAVGETDSPKVPDDDPPSSPPPSAA